MADPKWFAIKTNAFTRPVTKMDKLIKELEVDKIKLQRLSRDSFSAAAFKQWLRVQGKPRQSPIEVMLQATKSIKKVAEDSETKLKAAKSKTSDSLLTDPQRIWSRRQFETNMPIPHGFRYHANGDERVPPSREPEESESVIEPSDQEEIDFLPLQQTLVKAALIHSRDENGDYRFTPVLNKLLRQDLRITKSATDPFENLGSLGVVAQDQKRAWELKQRAVSEPVLKSTERTRDTPVLARDYLIRESENFKQQIVQHIRQIERRLNEIPTSAHGRCVPCLPNIQRIGIFPSRGSSSIRIEPSLRVSQSTRNTSLLRAKSSFNMRYGVSSQLLASRKPLLDEYRSLEDERTARLEAEIEEFSKEMTQIKMERDRKLSGTEDALHVGLSNVAKQTNIKPRVHEAERANLWSFQNLAELNQTRSSASRSQSDTRSSSPFD